MQAIPAYTPATPEAEAARLTDELFARVFNRRDLPPTAALALPVNNRPAPSANALVLA